MDLSPKFFTVMRIDGDYAHLMPKDDPAGEEVFVARALLPEDIDEGCTLKYEMLEYEIVG